ncbi:methyl-accepting chemotaxis protein [Roseateles asaccharophilus]
MLNLAQTPSASATGLGEFFRYHGWLSPGVRLFRKLSFPAKAACIAAAFAVPLVMLAWLVWSVSQGLISSTRHELQGLRYVTAIHEVTASAQNRRRAATTQVADLNEAQAKVDAAWAKLEAVHRQEGAELGMDKSFAAARESHEALRRSPAGATPDETFAKHNQFVKTLLSLEMDAADGAELSLDPELDTYHLMLLGVQRGPALLEQLAELRGLGTLALKSGELPYDRRRHITDNLAVIPFLQGDMLRSHQQGIESGAAEVAKRLSSQEADQAVRAFVAAANEQLLGAELKGSADDFLKLGNAAVAALADYNSRVLARLDERLKERIDVKNRMLAVEASIVAGFLLLALYLMLSFYKVMMGGLNEVSEHLREITRGNLATAPKPWGRDEAAELMVTLGEMQVALRRIVSAVLSGSAQVQNSSGEIADAAVDLSSRTEQSAANLEQTAATMEHIAEQVRQTAATVDGAARIVHDNAGAAGQCGQVISDVVRTMEEIRQSSGRIGEIIGTIDGIAFQTNILALNAAVEAARAGEQGRGFAVVASEVRALAQRSAQAAKEIKTLINTSIEQVESGHSVVGQAREMVAGIVTNAAHMATMMREITESTQQQRQAVVEVGQAVQALDQTTQQNATLVDQTSASASGLAEQAQRLNAEISFFKLA